MPLSLCPSAHGILTQDLRRAVTHRTLEVLTVPDTPHGFIVRVQLTWAKDHEWFLTTRRLPHTPRLFKSLHRLNEHLRKMAPTVPVHLLRHIGS